ncbi:hypothetical protein AZH51_14070 [Branchiibius sp. NY16-3462-2]|nr:hypothetical protein AZH51_14070 [Branchiibius sp. NY16-3462-2]
MGVHYPGPVPLTPTRVDGNYVYACMMGAGFAVDPKTGKPAEARSIYPTRFKVVKGAQGYVISTYGNDPAIHCDGVNIVRRAW